MGSELKSSGKPFAISKREVWEAYEQVKANDGASRKKSRRLRTTKRPESPCVGSPRSPVSTLGNLSDMSFLSRLDVQQQLLTFMTFNAFVGHQEAIRSLPPAATLLGSSPTCPVQMFRVRSNVYATQFHPELDLPGVLTRIEVYSTYGYFDPSEASDLKAKSEAVDVRHPMTILRNFAARYRSESKL